MTSVDVFARCLGQLTAGLTPLPCKPDETPDATLRALWHLASGHALSVPVAMATPLPSLTPDAAVRLNRLIEQRLDGVPLAHLTGVQRFMELDFLVGKEALIPRRETEILGYAALSGLRELTRERDSLRVLDVCTGSGNLAVAIAHYEPKARVFASDLSADAVSLAEKNAIRLGLEKRLEFRQGDLLAPFDTPDFHHSLDLLLCNPPYIPEAKVPAMASEISGHEPSLAFNGGPYGISILLRLIREAPRLLRKGGMLAFEVGLGQGSGIVRRLEKGPFAAVRSIADEHGSVRAILATAGGEPRA
jgi:release factor glutamine methyltransferase